MDHDDFRREFERSRTIGFSVFGVVVFLMITCVICCLIYARHRRRMTATNQPHYQAINLQPGHPPGGLQQTQPTMPQQSYPAAYPGGLQQTQPTMPQQSYPAAYPGYPPQQQQPPMVQPGYAAPLQPAGLTSYAPQYQPIQPTNASAPPDYTAAVHMELPPQNPNYPSAPSMQAPPPEKM